MHKTNLAGSTVHAINDEAYSTQYSCSPSAKYIAQQFIFTVPTS